MYEFYNVIRNTVSHLQWGGVIDHSLHDQMQEALTVELKVKCDVRIAPLLSPHFRTSASFLYPIFSIQCLAS